MFTGIVEETGKIENIRRNGNSAVLAIRAGKVLEGTKEGDSIAVNGICLTVTSLGSGIFTADVMPETIMRSSLKDAGPGTRVNLERAMAAGGRFGGHIVTGHVDGTGIVSGLKRDGNAIRYRIAASPKLLKYVIEKGSVTIDGISLTVTDVDDESLEVSVIPHTASNTVLSDRKPGSCVNLETDIIGKYLEKLMLSAAGDGAKTTDTSLKPDFEEAANPKADRQRKNNVITKEFLMKYDF
ncbi:MAG: riboflavin synthase [Clostridia bacterium]|nr:riboflavin synthase [Clostridia bacterium]